MSALAQTVMMIRPASFGFNAEAARTNRWSRPPAEARVAEVAREETERFAEALALAGVNVLLLEDTPSPARPDAVFPNNWVSFHRDGKVALYPMCPATRRAERRRDLVDEIAARGFRVGRVLDFSPEEARGRFLEGTGSMVLDRVHHVAFASLSPRTDAGLLAEVAPRLGYRPHAFRAQLDGQPPYHTNVILSVGDGLALWCPDTVVDEDRAALRAALDGRDVIDLAPAQVHAFAGNVLQLAGVVALSRTALASLSPAQVATLERHGAIVAADLDTIERVGGGSARCMLAEVFLPLTA